MPTREREPTKSRPQARSTSKTEHAMKLHRLTVRGKGRFPINMLAYDNCWPASEDDAAAIKASLMPLEEMDWQTERTVSLISPYPFTPERWKSFSWPLFNSIRKITRGDSQYPVSVVE